MHSNHNLAVTFTLTPVLQNVEKKQIFQEIGGCLNRICLLQNSLLAKPISFKCNFVSFETFSYEEENERQIPLALCNHLEFFFILANYGVKTGYLNAKIPKLTMNKHFSSL